MTTNVDALRLRNTWGREGWRVPQPFGPDGWRMTNRAGGASVIVTTANLDGSPVEWVHASVARPTMPTYDDLVTLHRSVWGTTGYAYLMFVPVATHVNIHEHALHLWGRLDGRAALPDFGAVLGSI